MSVDKRIPPYRFSSRQHIWLASFVALPYAMYGALLVMFCLMVSAMISRGRSVWRLCGQWGFGWLSGGLLLSASFGIHRGDAFLGLVHFLPFFVLWGVFATDPKLVAQPFTQLETLARWLVLSALPLCAIALIEYCLKFESLIAPIQASPLPQWLLGWLYEEPYFGHRARSLFDHPNGLSAYLVVILGLGLGLVLKDFISPVSIGPVSIGPVSISPVSISPVDKVTSARTGAVTSSPLSSSLSSPLSLPLSFPFQTPWLIAAVIFCLVAIFCTGSRNGVLIALVLVGFALYRARRYRWAWLSGAVGIGAIASAVLRFGIGGRSLSLDIFTQDPRISVWRLAIEMIGQRPWLGWGLSGYRERYVPGSIPDYDIIFHAHNVWLFLASETGIPVTVGCCAIVGTITYRAMQVYRVTDENSGLSTGDKAILLSYLLAFFACLMFALFDVVLYDARLNILFWGLLAALYLLSGFRSRRASIPKRQLSETKRQLNDAVKQS